MNKNSDELELLLKENPEWRRLSFNISRNKNQNAIELLKKNQDYIYWTYFSENSSIFEIDENNKKIINNTISLILS